jgi:radical SAM superfamily enzyme YgiQ (UPF0313 family)
MLVYAGRKRAVRVLLLYPEFPDTFWSFRHALKFLRKKAFSPPLGLLTIAAMLPEEWGLRLIDLNVTKLTDRDLAWADCVFVSAMLVQRDAARHVIARCKNAGLMVVAGGPLFIGEHEKFPEVDHFVLNEAELTLPEFLRDLEKGKTRQVYSTSAFADIRQSPTPLWHLADLKAYGTVSIQYSRGCPFRCEFCNIVTLFGHRPRVKTGRQFIAELDALYEQGWRGSIFVVDDNFIGNKKQLKNDLLPAMIAWRKQHPGINFYTEASIDLADDAALVAMMVAAGFDTVFVGIESPNEESLAECRKGQNRNRNLMEDVKRLHRAGLQVQGGFILGFDSDPPSIFQKQIEFIQNSGIVTAMVGLLQALPGTSLYDRLQRAGRLHQETSGDNVDGSTNIAPLMGMETLLEGYRSVLATIYAPQNYYLRLRTFLREYRGPGVRVRATLGRQCAFIRSLFRLGLLGKERIQYWKTLIWTLLHRPDLFSTMVSLAIYGFHFRKICERNLLDSEK